MKEDMMGRDPEADPAACREIAGLLVPYLDGEATPEEAAAVEAHAAACTRCARALEVHRQVGEALRGGGRGAEPRPGLADRTRLEARREARSARLVRIALAAAALLAASGVVLLGPWAGNRVATPPAEDLLGNLDVLEVLQEEGLEPTDELVRLLLEESGDDPESARGDGALDPAIFDYLLEEELSEENL
jgi:hypothetical protein